MKKFKFNMEKVLTLRKFKEEECKIALGQAVGQLNLIENEIKQTALKKHSASVNRFQNPHDSLSWEMYINRLDHEAEVLTKKAAKAELVVEEKRALYMEAKKDLMALEKLKEKQKKEHRREMMNQEMNAVDELTSARLLSPLP